MRDYLHVEDHCRGIDLALRRGDPGTDYNIGTGGEIDGVTVADTVLRLLDRPPSLRQFVRDRPGHDRRYAVDSSRLRALGWEPRIDFDSGMAATVGWYQDNADWWRPLQSGEFWEFYRRNYHPLSPTTP